MKIKKVNLDRKPLDTAYVQQKQDFQQLISMYKKGTTPVWKQPLFYGVVGLASFAAVAVSTLVDFNSTPIEKKTTLVREEIKGDLAPRVIMAAHGSADSMLEDKAKVSMPEVRPTTFKTNTTKKDKLVAAEPEERLSTVEPMGSLVTSPKIKAVIPNISGASQGTLRASQLCGSEGITMDEETNITTFQVLYTVGLREKVVRVKGNKIPEEVCKDLERSGFEQMVFITEIKGEKDDKILSLPSLNFWVIKG